MKRFNVWISQGDGGSGLRVDGLENANWLLCRLSDFFVFKTSEPIHEVSNSPDCTFRVAHNSQLSGRELEKVLAGIWETKVTVEPPLPALTVVQPNERKTIERK
jgi:hypothetical protein